jgi:hypothetical protein
MKTVTIQDVLLDRDYRLVEDAWATHGRHTYLHDDDADHQYITNLTRLLRGAGWEVDRNKLRSFHHPQTGEIIEIEPGGSETTGHFLHLMKAP